MAHLLNAGPVMPQNAAGSGIGQCPTPPSSASSAGTARQDRPQRVRSAKWPSRCPMPLNQAALMVILMTMTTLSLAEAKSHLSELVGLVNAQHERVTVTVHGKPSAVLIATEDLESLEETIAILSDPDTLSRLAASDAELARGAGESQAQLAQAMNERRRQRA